MLNIESVRFHLYDKHILLIRGWNEGVGENKAVEVYLDKEKLKSEYTIQSGALVYQKYQQKNLNVNKETVLKVFLPKDWTRFQLLKILYGEERNVVYQEKVKNLKTRQINLPYVIDRKQLQENKLEITGWAVDKAQVKIKCFLDGKEQKDYQIERVYRKDVLKSFEEAEEAYKAGFRIIIPIKEEKRVEVRLFGDGKQAVYKGDITGKEKGFFQKLCQAVRNVCGIEGAAVEKEEGSITEEDSCYNEWMHNPGRKDEKERQRNTKLAYRPLFSIVVPIYRTEEAFLRKLIESVIAQTYEEWELCLADGSREKEKLEEIVMEYARRDSRIKYKCLGQNMGISENTNKAIKMADGEYLLFADHDDFIEDTALFECAKALNDVKKNRNQTVDLFYTDEDKVDMDGNYYFEPHYKPDLNVDLLCSMNYICHLFGVKRDILDRAGLLDAEFDGAQDYDLIFRCVEIASCIYHVPKILYHWRSHRESTAANPESKLYAFEAGKKAVEAHYERLGIPARVEHSEYYGMYRTEYVWEKKPLVSVIIYAKNYEKTVFQRCLESIMKLSYQKIEVIVLVGEQEALAEDSYWDNEKMTVIRQKEHKNISEVLNEGASYTKGEYLLFLNSGMEFIGTGGLIELLGVCMRADVGAAGAKICKKDDTILCAGITLEENRTLKYPCVGQSRFDPGYMGRNMCTQDYQAVSGDCLMTKRKVFEQAGGFSEQFSAEYYDVDYCLKLQELGLLVVYQPYSELYCCEKENKSVFDEKHSDKTKEL